MLLSAENFNSYIGLQFSNNATLFNSNVGIFSESCCCWLAEIRVNYSYIFAIIQVQQLYFKHISTTPKTFNFHTFFWHLL